MSDGVVKIRNLEFQVLVPHRPEHMTLEEKEKHSAEDFEAMQVDQLSLAAKELVPLIIALTPEDEWCRRAITFLKAWDYRLSSDSAAACIYEVFFTHLVRRTLEEKLGSWSDFFLGKGVHMLRPHTVSGQPGAGSLSPFSLPCWGCSASVSA